jgi:hypothetical protein
MRIKWNTDFKPNENLISTVCQFCQFLPDNSALIVQGVSAKTFEPNISVICQRIFVKFKMQIF